MAKVAETNSDISEIPEMYLNCGNKPIYIAGLMHRLYHMRFKCAKVDKHHNYWYENDFEAKWVPMSGAYKLRLELIDQVRIKFATYSRKLSQSKTGDKFFSQIHNLSSIANNLSETQFLNDVITECEYRFLDPNFNDAR